MQSPCVICLFRFPWIIIFFEYLRLPVVTFCVVFRVVSACFLCVVVLVFPTQNCSKLLKIAQNCAKLLKIAQNCSKLLKIAQNCSASCVFIVFQLFSGVILTSTTPPKIAQNCSKLFKTIKLHPLNLLKIILSKIVSSGVPFHHTGI